MDFFQGLLAFLKFVAKVIWEDVIICKIPDPEDFHSKIIVKEDNIFVDGEPIDRWYDERSSDPLLNRLVFVGAIGGLIAFCRFLSH